MAVIIVSSDLDEVLGLSHRVMVLSRGATAGSSIAKQAGRVAVMELATTFDRAHGESSRCVCSVLGTRSPS